MFSEDLKKANLKKYISVDFHFLKLLVCQLKFANVYNFDIYTV